MAADLGGTQMRAALVGRDGRVHHRITRYTRADEGRARVVDRFVGMLRRTASSIATESPVGVGLSLASPVEPETGVMRNPPNLPGWDGYTLKPVLEQGLSLRVSAGNDATLAALAEHRYGAGRPYSHFVYMTLSTGIGGGLILDGKPYTGAGGYGGEVGHVTIDRNGPVCGCGNVGCLEAAASGTAVARLTRERLAAGQPATLLGDEEDGPDSERVFQAARLGDPLAKAVVQEVGASLGVGIVSLLNAFDPQAFVIGGGMSGSLDLLLPAVDQEIARHAMVHHREGVPIVKSELSDDAGMVGAAVLVFEAYGPG